MSSYFEVRMSYAPKFALADLDDAMESFFAENYELALDFPEYVAANENAYFEQNTSYVNYLNVYGSSTGDKTNQEEMHAFANAFGEGWKVSIDSYGDTTITKAGVKVVLYTYSAYFQVRMSYTAPIPTLDEFPLEQVNAFCAEIGMGFSFTAEQAAGFTDPSGNGYSITNGADGNYKYIVVYVTGDAQEAWEGVLVPIITAAGYAPHDSYGYWNAQNDHVARVEYKEGYTRLVLFQ